MSFLIVGLLFLAAFLPPVFYGVFNVGNAIGLGFAAVFLILFVMKVKGVNLSILHTLPFKIVGMVLAVCLVIAAVETGFMVKICTTAPEKGATVLVLGCKVNGEQPSMMLQERIAAAVDYMNRNPETKAILSGGKGLDEVISEAECMRRELVRAGIDNTRLYLEDASTNTRENLRFSTALASAEGLSTDFAVVTNEFHEYRAFLTAKQLGVSFGAVPARTTFWLFPTFYVRELCGILYMWIFER